MRFLALVVTILACFAGTSCGSSAARQGADESASQLVDAPGVENVRRVSAHVYSGGEPKGADAFRTLARLGIRTVVSVDGARPDIEAARAAGLRYVHIPIGYDGIPRESSASLTRVARDIVGQSANVSSEPGRFGHGRIAGPIYVHCHHGKHRGPAAAAILCIAAGEATGTSATRILEDAGTSRDYAGLWRDVAAFTPPPEDAKLPELVEIAQVDSLVAAMASIDRAFDNLRLCRDAGWTTPRDHPDLVPAREAILLKEGFREAVRLPSGASDERFDDWLRTGEAVAAELEAALADAAHGQASELVARLAQSCHQCHARYRD